MATFTAETSGSPYESGYLRTSMNRQSISFFQPSANKNHKRHVRPRYSLPSRSPVSRRSYISLNRAPDAPRPHLQLNGDTVLFANPKRAYKPGGLTKATIVRELHSPNTLPSLSVTNDDIETCNDMPRTSTPFTRRNSKDTDASELLNSALIGAPRLALHLSATASDSDSNRPDPTGSIINMLHGCKLDFLKPFGTDAPVVRDKNTDGNFQSIKCNVAHSIHKTPQNGIDPSKLNELSPDQFRCRICLEGGDGAGALFSPCRCKGTVGLVHKACLQRWLYESGKPTCELCGYAYIMTPSKHKTFPSHLQTRTSAQQSAFQEWLHSVTTRKHLMTDLICLAFLTPSTYIGVYFCVAGAISFDSEDPSGWQVVGLWCLAVLMMLLLSSWLILAIRHHVSNFRHHLRLRRQREREEAERLAALPRWRFSIQPRPRGSSTLLPATLESGQNITYHSTFSVETQSAISPTLNEKSVSEVEVHTQMVPTPPNEIPDDTSPEIYVSLALSTVPEATEECVNASDERALQQLV